MTKYTPSPTPVGLGDIPRYLGQELQRVREAFLAIEDIELAELHVEPSKPRAGIVVLADGSDWNPGSGAGFYGYYGGSWNKLG